MKLFSNLLFLLPLTLVIPSASAKPKPYCACLTKKDADYILLKWSNLARQNYKAAGFKSLESLINHTVSENFKSYEETFNNGASNLNFEGRKNFLPGPKLGPDPVEKLTYKTIYTFHDCSNIAYRWQYSAETTGLDKIVFGPGPNDNK